jgi:hypothetical protein
MSDEVVQVIETPVIVQVVVGQVLTPGGGGGGVTDGDKGGIIVSSSGAVWTVKAGSITDLMLGASAIALFAAASHTHVIANITGLQAALDGKAAASHSHVAADVTDFAATTRATTLTGYAAAGSRLALAAGDTILGAFGKLGKWVADLSALAFSGNASDLSGTKTSAFISDFTEAAQDATGAMVDASLVYVDGTPLLTRAALTGDATAPQGSNALTLATVNSNVGSFGLAGSVAQFVVNAKGLITSAVNVAISIASTAISDSTAAGRAMLTAATATAQTALLDTFTSAAKGLVPPSGGGTANFLRADGTFATPAGGSPGGSSGEVQYNNGGAFAGAADVEIEGGQLRLPTISTPSAPATGGVKLFGMGYGNAPHPAFLGSLDAAPLALQMAIGEGNFMMWAPATGTTASVWGIPAAAVNGTATAAATDVGSRRARLKRLEYLVTTASTSALASWRWNSSQITIGGGNSWEGGFRGAMHGGPSTGVTNSSHRFFMGLIESFGGTDVNPSTQIRMVGIGYDAADTQVQVMYNDGSGTATKVALGASFPKPNADRAFTYRLRLYSPPGSTQSVSYEVTYRETGAVATGTITTDIPATTDRLQPLIYAGVGGVSSVVGIAVGPATFQTEPF